MDRLEAMSIFLEAVEAGSFWEAARRLSVPLATVSRKIADLESHLGATLLRRSPRRLALTDAGQGYLAACKRILEEVGEAERIAGGEYVAPKGELTMTTPIVFGRLHMLPIVVEFLKTYPEINVRLVQADAFVNLWDEPIDVALRIGALPDSRMVAARVGTVRRVVCASPAYLAANGTPNAPSELRAYDAICRDGLTQPEGWAFRIGEAEVYAPVRPRLQVNTAEAAVEAAVAGLGLTRLLSYQTAAALAAGDLRIVLEEFEPEPWPVSLVYPTQQLLPRKLRAFLDFAAPRLKQRLRALGAPRLEAVDAARLP